MKTKWWLSLALLLAATRLSGQTPPRDTKGLMVFQSDFGVKDGAVSAMKGVACGVDPNLKLYDLTHEIPAFNIWEASYRLWQTVPYWPAGTVFVSVVDPGVGTNRKSVVAAPKTGQYIVTPDNGTLTMVAEKLGLDAVREIDETKNRRAGFRGELHVPRPRRVRVHGRAAGGGGDRARGGRAGAGPGEDRDHRPTRILASRATASGAASPCSTRNTATCGRTSTSRFSPAAARAQTGRPSR